MPMHPKLQDAALSPVLEAIFSDAKKEALDKLEKAGFIDGITRPVWETELHNSSYQQGDSDLIAMTKMILDSKAAADGKLSSKAPISILSNLTPMMLLAKQLGYDYGPQLIKQRTAMDYGSGIYYPFSTSVVLFANGFEKAISFEPFELKVDYVVASLFELIRSIFEQPAKFCLPGVDKQDLKKNLARLSLEYLPDKLMALNRCEIPFVDLGGVILTNKSDSIVNSSVDMIFSNSVLEHVADLAAELQWHKRILTERGLCLHTVDFVDHRYYFDKSLNILEMCYDGILDEINGLRPSQMEAEFLSAGFGCYKLQKLAIPEALISRDRQLAAPFSKLSPGDLLEWVNGYILHKR